MNNFSTPLTKDQDIFDWEPDLSGATKIADKVDQLHISASEDVNRDIRSKWWAKVVRQNEIVAKPGEVGETTTPVSSFDPNKLDLTQVKNLAVYRLLGWYIWPLLDEHNSDNTFPIKRSNHWKKRYSDEFAELLKDGIAYDWNDSGTAEYLTESVPVSTRSVSIGRG